MGFWRRLIGGSRPAPQNDWKIWQTVSLGVMKSPEDYRRELQKRKITVKTEAEEMLDLLSIASAPVEVDLVIISSVDQLGLSERPDRDLFFDTARSKGLALCPPELGPALRLAYPDQGVIPFSIAMDPIVISSGCRYLFNLTMTGFANDFSDRKLYIDAAVSRPGPVVVHSWDRRWIFVLPRQRAGSVQRST